ncbi:MAG: NAD(P)H-hydrate dehydratase [Planctomycetaceae bacterium]|nr:NAD(P)H-hydrate dehydratase [Planctomycetaceae bacterium]
MPLDLIDSVPALPARLASGHKGTFGRVLLVAGSWGMTGAAILAGRSALRSGAGLVYVATPECCVPLIAGGEPSYLTIPLPEVRPGVLQATASDVAFQATSGMNAVGIGPGLGQGAHVDTVVRGMYANCVAPGVVDADALNLLAQADCSNWSTHAAPRILTPHPGEFAKITGQTIEAIQSDRVGLAADFAAQHDVVIVLKGAGTVITDGTRYAINATGNSGLATGGSGDVLTGVITALLGQGMLPFEAARLGVHLHGLAGDLAARGLTEYGVIASDLPDCLPAAFRAHLDQTS